MSTPRNRFVGALSLPERPSLEHLKSEAKRRLRELRASTPLAQLADAQFAVARDYGFPSWRELKAEIDRRAASGPPDTHRITRLDLCVGAYRYNPAVVTNGVITIRREEGRLFVQTIDGPTVALVEQGDGTFSYPGLRRTYEFLGDGPGPASTLMMRDERGAVGLRRVTDANLEEIKAAVAKAMAEQARPRASIILSPEALERFVGHYSTRLGPAMAVTRDGGRLYAQVVGQQRLEIHPETESDFFWTHLPAQVSFQVGANGVDAAVVHQSGRSQRLTRVSSDVAAAVSKTIAERASQQMRPRAVIEVEPAVLDGYVGRYRLDERRTLDVTAEGGRLFVEITGQARYEVFPETRHDFFWTVVAAQITFITDEAGRASGAILHQSGRDVPLARLVGSDA